MTSMDFISEPSRESETDHHATIRHKPLAEFNSSSADSGLGSISEMEESPHTSSSMRETSVCFGPDREASIDSLLGEDDPDFPENIASQALRMHYSTLVEAITHQISIIAIAPQLYSYQLIENAVYSKVQTLGIPDETKTSDVLNAVMSKIRISQDVAPFDIFMQVLDGHPCCHEIVVQIKANYEQLRQSYTASDGPYMPGPDERQELVCCKPSVPQHMSPKYTPWQEVGLHPMDTATEHHHIGLKPPIRQRSTSSGNESDMSMTEEDIQRELRRLQKGSTRLERGIRKYMDRTLEPVKDKMKETLYRTQLEVEELQKQVEDYSQQIEMCSEQKQLLEGQLQIARRQILQLNKEIIALKRPGHPCATNCEHKAQCEKLGKRIKRMEEERLEYIATIENLTQQRDLLLNDRLY